MKIYTPKYTYSQREQEQPILKYAVVGILGGIVFWLSIGILLAAFA